MGASFSKLQVALYENVVGLVEAFYNSISTHFIYNYHGFAINLTQVGLTPTLELSEKDLASIYRSVLRGLKYIHKQLYIAHRGVKCNNIILYSNRAIKIDLNRENVSSLLLQLGDSHGYIKNPENIPRKAACRLSKYTTHFIEHIGSSLYSYIFEHTFFQQVESDSRT
ncbi:Protein kinase-like domain [Penicillium roqueforti FM164]|uniref:Protein kinase-like domain n=1 Tax=Penicillium roqueforti (strain FM164) TaxID=1365484 RepID=W6QAD5_PENRF|nr:Protein kinase-like domain [Penicillium roqueforti FM164]